MSLHRLGYPKGVIQFEAVEELRTVLTITVMFAG